MNERHRTRATILQRPFVNLDDSTNRVSQNKRKIYIN